MVWVESDIFQDTEDILKEVTQTVIHVWFRMQNRFNGINGTSLHDKPQKGFLMFVKYNNLGGHKNLYHLTEMLELREF